MGTPWGRAAVFYLAFLWRGLFLCLGLFLHFFFFYGLIKFLLDPWPLVESLVRIALIVGILALALSFAIQWTVQARFGTMMLRIVPPGESADFHLTFGRAARVLWAHIWRAAVVTI